VKQRVAALKCHNMSAELASIHDMEENTFVMNMLVLYIIIRLATKLNKPVFVFITCCVILKCRYISVCV